MADTENFDLDAAKLGAILDSAVDAIITVDGSGIIESVNPAVTRLFQYEADELLGRNVSILMGDADRDAHDGYMHHHMTTGEKRIIGIGREVEGRRKDGTMFPLHLSVSRFEFSGEPHFTEIIHDLTSVRQTELALQQAQRMEAIGQLTGGIAHDFNNLLTVVTGNLELMEPRLDDEFLLSLLKEAQEASELGARLTDRLLTFARRSRLEPEVVDLNTLVVGLTDLLHRTLGGEIELSSALSTDLWPILVDRGQVENAIINLAVNARDAMPSGGYVFIETDNSVLDDGFGDPNADVVPGDYVRLSISDDGSGIEPQILARVFEPFFTTKEVGRGTGLGLSMVYGFAKQSNGYATIYSEVGTGTTVNLYLPRHRSAEEPVEDRPAEAPTTTYGTGETILVAEDDERVRALTVRRLRDLGYKVYEAENGPTALARLTELDDLALLFTDLVMPGGMTGYELVDAARNVKPDLKVLLTSGYAADLVRSKSSTNTRVRLLRKPYRQAELSAAIRRALSE
ncbi:MAG: PAS domain S-box protein [Pseudomonadota bacterium]